jgi:YHS domain-containing protein
MFRLLFRFLILLILIGLIRYLFAVVSRAISQTFNPHTPPRASSAPSSGNLGGELKQDPVCGTYVSTKTSVKKTINGELVHFCSIDCRDKFKVA